MRACTCPDCGEELVITCPSRCARASLGAAADAASPAIDAASRNVMGMRRGPYKGSVTERVLRLIEHGGEWRSVELEAAVAAEKAVAPAVVANALSCLTKAGAIRRLRRGVYGRAA